MTTPKTLVVACLLLLGGPPAAGQELSSIAADFHIKPSEVGVPEGVPLGQYRRTITPFENWTLVCDENLQAKQMVCNVSQIIADGSGTMMFSWSLAATEDGKPFMVLRTAPNADTAGKISIAFPGRASLVQVAFDGCNETVCVGIVPVGPVMREQIGKEAQPVISYSTSTGKKISITASLKGLGTALSAIK